jgi:hypothetical protein
VPTVGPPSDGREPGTVTVGNRTFVPDGKQPVPDGAIVDVSNGRGIELTDREGDSTIFFGQKDGVPSKFVVDKIGGLIELRLIGGNFATARAQQGSDAKKKPVRRLWAKGKGNFRTRGRLASATVRGTFWLTADFRTYTFVLVRQGSVTARDLVKRKTVIVRAGKSYKAFKKP